MYQVYKNDKPVGKPFSDQQQANDYARSIGGVVRPAPATQGKQLDQQKLTQ
jgi:hypothetical protein